MTSHLKAHRTSWIQRLLGGPTRTWGVMANSGAVVRSGFESERAAQNWSWRAKLQNYEIYSVEHDDLLQPSASHTVSRVSP